MGIRKSQLIGRTYPKAGRRLDNIGITPSRHNYCEPSWHKARGNMRAVPATGEFVCHDSQQITHAPDRNLSFLTGEPFCHKRYDRGYKPSVHRERGAADEGAERSS